MLLLVRRNVRLFVRDRMGVFLSLLSALILFALYAFFLGNLQLSNITDKYPAADHGQARQFVASWVFAGILLTTTLTSSLASTSTFVDDRVTGRFKDFRVTPMRRSELISAYTLSGVVISVGASVVVLAAGQAFISATGGQLVTVVELVKVLGYILLLSTCFAALSALIATFIRSSSAFSSFSVIVGSVVGFLAGAYIPLGALPVGVVNVINALPFSQGAMLLRRPLTEQAERRLTSGDKASSAYVQNFYGIRLSVGDHTVGPALAAAVIAGLLVVFVGLGVARQNAKLR